ncbi:amidohydrolase family protein [Tessaracoccus defluvii]|uniref:Amidohydrolase family protein n=1 Tax=Tessaracoccus defluvii TaxID=1285901 RepID=A0A7H0H7P9_9ACTN|nr:amidohydrolase family protein [Tessaracoccus defluvii]QNP56565.1 amidohydrolase family protein [Tessaracoccus defluvii]
MATSFALTNATVVTADAAGTVHRDWTIAVDAAGTISHAGPSTSIGLAPGLARIDAGGRFVLPGLINAHAHLFADGTLLPPFYTKPATVDLVARFLRSFAGRLVLRRRTRANLATQLRSGVTTLRSVGDVAYEVVEARTEIEAGRLVGPRVLASGPLMAITGGHGAPTIALICDTPAQARANTRSSRRAGVTAIKIAATAGVSDAKEVGYAGRPEMPEESMRVICQEAHEAGVLVAAHAQSADGVAAALRAGVDTIEHGSAMNEEIIGLFLDNPASLRGSSALIPTMQAALPLTKLPIEDTGADPVVRANAELIVEEMLTGIRTAMEHGIRMGVGTDSAVSFVTHSNFWRTVSVGRTPRSTGSRRSTLCWTASSRPGRRRDPRRPCATALSAWPRRSATTSCPGPSPR